MLVDANLLLFAPYDEWNASEWGNRFLFPGLAAGLALQGPLWDRVVPWVTRRRRNPVDTPAAASDAR